MRLITFKDAIRESLEEALYDKRVILIGEGAPDPKAVFGTTAGLKEKFPGQVFDMPISENGMTGVCIGAAINGLKPVLVHQRIDFSLYSADQLINNAAKWYSMYGGQKSVPMVVRMIIGRGWGQGNQHSQNLTALYAHVPGLKIFVPSNAADAKLMLREAIQYQGPVLFIENRWLYETTSEFSEHDVHLPAGFPRKISDGNKVTMVAIGHAVKEATLALKWIAPGTVDLFDIRSIRPLPIYEIINSVSETQALIVVDDAWPFCGVAAEIIAQVVETVPMLKCVHRVTYPDKPSASSPALAADFYAGPYDICRAVRRVGDYVDLAEARGYQLARTHDVPDKNFRGPF